MVEIEAAVDQFATDNPAYGQLRVSNELKKQGKFVPPGGVRSIWLRHDLETFKKRLKSTYGNLIHLVCAGLNYLLKNNIFLSIAIK